MNFPRPQHFVALLLLATTCITPRDAARRRSQHPAAVAPPVACDSVCIEQPRQPPTVAPPTRPALPSAPVLPVARAADTTRAVVQTQAGPVMLRPGQVDTLLARLALVERQLAVAQTTTRALDSTPRHRPRRETQAGPVIPAKPQATGPSTTTTPAPVAPSLLRGALDLVAVVLGGNYWVLGVVGLGIIFTVFYNLKGKRRNEK